MASTGKLLFGGLDPALRVDNTAFTSVELTEGGILEHYGSVVWPHIHPEKIGNELEAINQEDKHVAIGYDRLGTGEMVKLFPNKIRGVMEEVISSMNMKQDIIGLLKTLWDKEKLIIKDELLYKEILEQERYISDAGNILYRHPQGFHDDRFWSLGIAALTAAKYMKRGAYTRVAVSTPKKSVEGQITDEMMRNI